MTLVRIVLAFALLALGALPAAADPPVYQVNGVALGGTDPVAYATEGRPVEGDAAYSASYDGATWHFASAVNRDLFLSDPERYAPQYGGWCAYAAAKGAKAPTDPDAWSVINGRLYLNFSEDVRSRWLGDAADYIAAADAAWPALRDR
jgi:YHS domain-containing protein